MFLKKKIFIELSAISIALFAFSLLPSAPGKANTAPAGSRCTGNVCEGEISVGGRSARYSWTQHVSPNGELKVRVSGADRYTTSSIISFNISGLPPFSSWRSYENASAGAQLLPEEEASPDRTSYEKRDPNGCVDCAVDEVLAVKFSGLASGQYAFNLRALQFGDLGVVNNIIFYSDAQAPSNNDESFVWPDVPGMDAPCSDHIDDDLNYAADCVDIKCAGKVGDVVAGKNCERPETACSDSFDNDGDGNADCRDSDCNGKAGDAAGNLCQFGNERGSGSCTDGFDNDGDGLADCADNVSSPAGNSANTCWKQVGYGCPATESSCTDGADNDFDVSFGESWDNQPTTGINCLDYDCAGNPACPSQEHKTAAGADADAQCFDGIDNDLDGQTDCAEAECKGVYNPAQPLQSCYDKEIDVGQRYNFCSNNFNDDGDAGTDCADTDCRRSFGSCGPCPAREDITYDACADRADNDADADIDCADGDCIGKLGTLTDAARCELAENSADLCGDGFDNDADGAADCADSGCAGISGPDGVVCEPAGETRCGDGFDNDADGAADCADSDCWGRLACAPKDWTTSECQEVPRFSAWTPFTSSNPTVYARSFAATHVNSMDVIRLRGTLPSGSSYSSITIIIGDNTDPAAYYPYASSSCLLSDVSGNASSRLSMYPVIDGRAIHIFNTTSPVDDFDIQITCPTPADPAPARTYPISMKVTKSPGGEPEEGDALFSTTLFEATPPTIIEIEGEGADFSVSPQRVNLKYGSRRALRAVPFDPGTPPLESSGICRCIVTAGGVDHVSPDGNCVTAPIQFDSDNQSLSVTAQAQDGADNIGPIPPYSTTINVNVTPANIAPLSVAPSKPFFKDGRRIITFRDAEFRTGFADTFDTACDVFIRDTSGVIVGGPVGPTLSFPGQNIGNVIVCAGSAELPSMPDGEYFVTIRVRDSDGDTAESNRKVMYMCNRIPQPGEPETVCSKADFDQDGAAEGLYTTKYTLAPRICDNCANLSNPDQKDENANGIGEACEGARNKRCEFDRDYVCDCDSEPLPCSVPDGIRCPAPSIAPPPRSPQRCIPMGECTETGKMCRLDDPRSGDLECVGADGQGGFGKCAGDAAKQCKRVEDCESQGTTGPCQGADVCESLINPWLQSEFGSLFSGKHILARQPPPPLQFNATYCISAKGLIENFASARCELTPQEVSRIERPKPTTYATVLGRVDVTGILNGRYGEIVRVPAGQFAVPVPLDGKVYVVDGNLVVGAAEVANAPTGSKGNGTVVVRGGNIFFSGSITYDTAPVTTLSRLASIGWIAIPDENGSGGNIYVDKDVTDLAGAIFSGGSQGIFTVTPADVDPVRGASDSPLQLRISGLMVARRYTFSRSYKSTTEGAEKVTFDGRAVANPPPGFGDLAKTLPLISLTAP